MRHYYENVPRLRNVAVSRHAQSQMLDAGISKRRSTARCSILHSRTLPTDRISSGESVTGCGWLSS